MTSCSASTTTASASATSCSASSPRFTHANIADELTEFNVAEPATAWWDEALEWNREEYLYNRTPIEGSAPRRRR
jgi:hypothetical protein